MTSTAWPCSRCRRQVTCHSSPRSSRTTRSMRCSSLVSTDGVGAVEPIDFAGTDASEQMVLTDGIDGSLLFAVTPYERSSGTFEFSVRPAEVDSIEVGETVQRHLDAGVLALYTVPRGRRPLGVAVTSTDGFLASVSATAPDGEEFVLL